MAEGDGFDVFAGEDLLELVESLSYFICIPDVQLADLGRICSTESCSNG